MPIEHRMKPLSLIPELPMPETSYQEQQRLETYSDHESDDTRATMFALRETYLRSGRKVLLPNYQRAQFQRVARREHHRREVTKVSSLMQAITETANDQTPRLGTYTSVTRSAIPDTISALQTYRLPSTRHISD